MQPVFFTVGPTQLYPTVKAHLAEALSLNIPSLSHRGGQFEALYEETLAHLRTLMQIPETHRIFFLASGTEAMERTIQNCVAKKSGHVTYGSFSKRWQSIAASLGKQPEHISVPEGEVPDLTTVQFSPDVEFIALTHNETSTGAALPFSDIRALKAAHPHALIGVDIVSSAPVIPVDWGAVDCAFFSVQKGFGLPAGLAVLIVSPRAFDKAAVVAHEHSTGSYHSFSDLQKYADRNQTPETPNVLGIYLLNRVAADFCRSSADVLLATAQHRADTLYALLDRSALTPFVTNRKGRSLTTIAAVVPGGSQPLIEKLKAKGLVVGAGYGQFKEQQIRIGNFPAHTDEDYERLYAALAETR